ncbi:MAG: hypothetical protein KDD36_12570 [Flavobacteriales bacterium]|nr:hypothetical protein [Flavobacteriales bacterium]
MKEPLKMDGIREDSRLRFSLRNNINALLSLIIGFLLSMIVLIFLQFDPYALLAFGIWYGIDVVITLYLHIEYWLKNKGEEYEVHFDELVRFKNGESTVFKVSDIEKIKVYMSPALYRGSNLHFLGIEAYHYARVYLTSGEELIITCLLTPKIEKALRGLRGVKVERKKRVFNTLEWK